MRLTQDEIDLLVQHHQRYAEWYAALADQAKRDANPDRQETRKAAENYHRSRLEIVANAAPEPLSHPVE